MHGRKCSEFSISLVILAFFDGYQMYLDEVSAEFLRQSSDLLVTTFKQQRAHREHHNIFARKVFCPALMLC